MAWDQQILRMIDRIAGRRGIEDERALYAIALGEGGLMDREGDVGDLAGGGSYGPFQLYAQGALPARFRGNPQAADDWAWSRQGLRYAIGQMAELGLEGMSGPQLIENIIRRFERPADPDKSVAAALARYNDPSLTFPGGGQMAAAAPGAAPTQMMPQVDPRAQFAAQMLSRRRPQLAPVLRSLASPVELSAASGAAAAGSVASPGGSSGGKVIMPIGSKPPGSSEFLTVDAEGAPGPGGRRYHAAVDWFGAAGAPVVAPTGGEIVEVRRSKTNSGQVFGGVVKLRMPDGRVVVFRHVDPVGLKVGQRVGAGDVLAHITAWASGSPHAHIELWKSLEGGYNVANMIDPMSFFR